MNDNKTGSLVLSVAARHLKPVMLVFSVFILLRGHDYPGGGFIAGLIAGSGIVIDAVANKKEKALKKTMARSEYIIGSGLLLLLISALAGPFLGKAYLTGLWISIPLPLLNELSLGTPLMFDTGVFLVVTGMLVLVVFTILEELQWS